MIMKKMNKLAFALLMILASLTSSVWAQDKAADLAIVVNSASSLDNVSSADLVKIFKAEKAKSADGTKFVLAVREAGSPERAAALKSIYGMSDSEYEKFFLQATFAGTVQSAPKALGSASSVKQFVAGSPGAICYMRGSDVDSSVKVLKVDGKSPGDADYPIKIK